MKDKKFDTLSDVVLCLLRTVQEENPRGCIGCVQTETNTCSWLRDRFSFSSTYIQSVKIRERETHAVFLLVQVYEYAAALLDALDALLLGGRLLVRTVQSERHGGETLRLTERARLESSFLPAAVPGDVEGVALSVAEAVEDGAADAALLVDGLLERLRLAPVPFQILALCHVQSLLAGLQNLVGW